MHSPTNWLTASQEAITRLESASHGASVKDAAFWQPLVSSLDSTRAASRTLGLTVLLELTQRLIDTIGALRSGVVDLSPASLQLLLRALKKWVELRIAWAATEADAETQSILRALGGQSEASLAASRSPAQIADMAKYLPLFVEETEEGLEVMQTSLLELETGVKKSGFLPPQGLVDELFRHAHKLKASSAAMGFSHLAELTHTLENVLDRVRAGALRASPDLVSTMLAALDRVRSEVQVARSGQVPQSDLIDERASLMWYLESAPSPVVGVANPETAAVAAKGPALSEREAIQSALAQGQTVYRVVLQAKAGIAAPEMRILLTLNRLKGFGTTLSSSVPLDQIEKQDGLSSLQIVFATSENRELIISLVKDDELETPSVEPAVSQTASTETPAPTPAPAPAIPRAAAPQNIRVSISRLDDLMNLSGELSHAKNGFVSVSQKMRGWVGHKKDDAPSPDKIATALEEAISQLSQLVSGIQQTILELRMVPIAPLFERCRRVVRDIAQELGKEVDLVVHGGETSLDKKIIDQLGDPLLHMMRNAVDHGMETPTARVQVGKPSHGTILLKAEREGSRICVTVEDDGRGLALEEIRHKIVAQSLATADAAAKMSTRELVPFIFQAGFSTAHAVTQISGRGVGMDIVRRRIEEISGTIEVDTEPGKRTCFRIRLPLTVVSQNSLVFDIEGVTFAFPLQSVSEILQVSTKDLMDTGFGKFLRLRDTLLPVFRIGHFFQNTPFGGKTAAPATTSSSVVVVQAGKQRLGLVVDKILGEEEVLIKNPGELVGEIAGIAGVTVLSSGNVALILDVEAMIERSALEMKEPYASSRIATNS
jgi:two-component system, chemotaxis family, sensor kinase CheA